MSKPTSALQDAHATRTATPASRIDVEGWGWRHAARKAWALRDITVHANPGERILLLGPSGSGKSTLMAGLAGLLGGSEEGEAEGSLTVDGESPAHVRGKVGLLMQDPEAQVVLARVGDDVAFGMENLGVAPADIWPRVTSSLEAVGLEVPLEHSTSALSGGQKQRLALASILAMNPGVLLLDEPTANLDPDGVAEVRAAVEKVLDKSGATLVVVEHRVDVWAPLVDRVIVINDGRIIADGPTQCVLSAQAQMLREAGIWLPGEDVSAEAAPASSAPAASSATSSARPIPVRPIASVRDLAIGYDPEAPVRTGITVDIPRGVSTCIVGSNGAGKSTFALTLAGLLPQISGSVTLNLSDGTSADPHALRSADLLGRISMVFQEPEYQFLARTLADELALGPRAAGMSEEDIAPLVKEHLEALGLSALAGANPMTLSGGEKRRLSVATALINAPELLILDEPTFGQDRTTWLSLVRLLRGVVERGTTLVCITHDPAFIKVMGDNVIDLGTLGEKQNNEKTLCPDPRTIETKEPIKKRKLERTNPVTRLLALLIATTPLLITIDPLSAAVALGLTVMLAPFSGVRVRTFALKSAPLLFLAPLGALSMLLYAVPGGSVYLQFGPAVISDQSIWLAAGIALRMCALVIPAILLLDNLDPTDLGDGLAQVLHMPARPVLATLAGARMIGLMTADWKALERARRARGVGDAGKIRSFFRGAFSLLVFALRRSAKLATTMEARGFGAPGKRTWARPSRLGMPDALLAAIAVAIPALALAASVWAGTFTLVGR